MKKDPKQYTNLAQMSEYRPVVDGFKAKFAVKMKAFRTNDLPQKRLNRGQAIHTRGGGEVVGEF
jgi:hypothetical protein